MSVLNLIKGKKNTSFNKIEWELRIQGEQVQLVAHGTLNNHFYCQTIALMTVNGTLEMVQGIKLDGIRIDKTGRMVVQ